MSCLYRPNSIVLAVTGYIGSGKTHWIREQIAQIRIPALYFSPQTGDFPLDGMRIESEFPQVKVLKTASEQELRGFSEDGGRVYLELPWYLDLSACEALLQRLQCHRVAIMPPNLTNTGWHAWADEVIPGNQFEREKELDSSPNSSLQIQRELLTGEVVDFASLETFWQELIQGAYGQVIRVKGIFDIADGQCIYGDYFQGLPVTEFKALNLPRWLSGKPPHFSGLEIIGRNLDKAIIAETLGDFCLSESAIATYQEQVQRLPLS